MGRVHIRRALLLFAIVLGMAALVASLSRPIEERRGKTTARQPREPTVTPAPSPEAPTTLAFDAVENEARRLPAGRAATIEVEVDEPGIVEIPALGRSAPANPLTPARFAILPNRPGRYELRFTPSTGDTPEIAGRLVITSAG